jgi:uncharacterized protein (TIRG00374 family)
MKSKRRSHPLWLWLLLGLLGAALLAWALRAVPLADILAVLRQLDLGQLLLLFIVNIGIVLLMGLRWWLILAALGHRLPFLAIIRYRLAAFGVSYFTPGPHFGGEPLQVYFVRNKHGVPGSRALAAVSMDKVLELLVNFAFLAFGVALVLSSGLLPSRLLGSDLLRNAQPLFLVMTFTPLAYLLALQTGRRPLGWLARRLPERWAVALTNTESALAELVGRPRALLLALGASLLVWAALLFEYWLALRVLGLSLPLLQIIAILTASRIAMLAPTPGALGALEAAQVFALSALGFDPAYGISLSLLIRARDVFFGVFGIWWGGAGLRLW